jgi:hypothetical protein
VRDMLDRPRLRAVIRAALLTSLAVLGPLAGSAPAATTTTSPTSLCSGALSQPFMRWADANMYTLAAGGDFEASGTPWSLSGGAGVVAGSESFAVTGSLGAGSLAVPVGGTAVSPNVCVDPTRETFRFFARNTSGSSKAKLKVEILYPTKSGSWMTILGGIYSSSAVGWQPSPIYLNSTNLALLSGQLNPPIRYRFTAAGGAWQVDDVHVDPMVRH